MRSGVIFDMDGVLVASAAPHHESWRALAGRHGIDVSDERFAATFGRPSRDIIRMLWGDHLSDAEIRRYDDEKERIYRDLIRDRIPLAPGVHAVLARLAQAGYVLAVATSGPPENLDLVLDGGRLRPYFAATVHGFDVERGKPAPDCFLLAAERAELSPARCLVVEDAPVGVAAALAAGMQAVGLVGTHDADRLRAAGACDVIERLAELTPARVAAHLSDESD